MLQPMTFQATYESHIDVQRTEKVEESATRAAESSRKRERNGSTPLCGESQYITKTPGIAECYGRSTDKQAKPHYHCRHYHALNQ